MTQRAHIISQQSQFYRNNFRKLLIFSFILLAIIYALLGYLFYRDLTQPKPEYFATTSNGQVIPLTPMAGTP